MPERIQLSRAKGWRKPVNTVVVSRTSSWGNEFRVGDTVRRVGSGDIVETIQVKDQAVAVALHRERMEYLLRHQPDVLRSALAELRGKNLACWCKLGTPCHVDTLLELANQEPPRG